MDHNTATKTHKQIHRSQIASHQPSMATWSKIGRFGARDGTSVDIPHNAPIKLNKLEAWKDQGMISGIRFSYTDKNQGLLPDPVTFGAVTGAYHCLFDATRDPTDYVVDLYGYAGTSFVHQLGVKTNNEAPDNPWGEATGRYFEIPVVGGSIVAFFGRSNGQSLNAVGAYVLPHGAS